MDNKKSLKKFGKHCINYNQTSLKKRKLSCEKRVQIVFNKKLTFDKIDIDSLELYRQIMASRYGKI